MKLFFLGLLTIIIIGCASTLKEVPPPQKELLPPVYQLSDDKDLESRNFFLDEQILNAEMLESTDERKKSLWWLRYKQAMIWQSVRPQVSCRNFKKLSKEIDFPLKDVAHLRALQYCDVDFFQESSEWNKLKEISWLKNYTLDIEIKQMESRDNHKALVDLYLRKSKLPLAKKHKIQLTSKALNSAYIIKDNVKKRQLKSRLNRFAPRLKKRPKPKDYLKVAYDYRRHRRFDKARQYYNKVIHSKASFYKKLVAYKGIRISYKLELKTPQYIEATEEMAKYVVRVFKRSKNKKYFYQYYHDVYVTLARTYWTKDQKKKASAVLSHLAKKFKNKWNLSKVYWLRGRLEEERGKFLSAHWWFKMADRELGNKKRHRAFKEKIQWLMAWNLYKAGHFKKVPQLLEVLSEKTESSFERSKYLYWLAKSYHKSNDSEKAQTIFNKLSEEDNVGFYGLMAQREMNGTVKLLVPKERSVASINSEALKEYYSLVDVNAMEWMISLGEKDLSKKYLDDLSYKLHKKKVMDSKVWMNVFRYYARSNEFLGLFTQLGQLPPGIRQSMLQKNPELIFPTPYQYFVKEAALKYGVSSEFIYSIMRQESAFNPNARSHADAFGLMQILPQTAFKAASRAKVTIAHANDLFKPHINIPIGSSFLRSLYDHYDGRLILAIASYNASERAINGWMQTRYRGDSIEFIEDIPYEETRGYVRLVLRNLVFYKLLNSPEKEIEFPHWVLNLKSGDVI